MKIASVAEVKARFSAFLKASEGGPVEVASGTRTLGHRLAGHRLPVGAGVRHYARRNRLRGLGRGDAGRADGRAVVGVDRREAAGCRLQRAARRLAAVGGDAFGVSECQTRDCRVPRAVVRRLGDGLWFGVAHCRTLLKPLNADSSEDDPMRTELYWVEGPWSGRLAIMPRPRGGDWLEEEIQSWRRSGIDVVVSLLIVGAESRDLPVPHLLQHFDRLFQGLPAGDWVCGLETASVDSGAQTGDNIEKSQNWA
jgi:hypothetical protein